MAPKWWVGDVSSVESSVFLSCWFLFVNCVRIHPCTWSRMLCPPICSCLIPLKSTQHILLLGHIFLIWMNSMSAARLSMPSVFSTTLIRNPLLLISRWYRVFNSSGVEGTNSTDLDPPLLYHCRFFSSFSFSRSERFHYFGLFILLSFLLHLSFSCSERFHSSGLLIGRIPSDSVLNSPRWTEMVCEHPEYCIFFKLLLDMSAKKFPSNVFAAVQKYQKYLLRQDCSFRLWWKCRFDMDDRFGRHFLLVVFVHKQQSFWWDDEERWRCTDPRC